MAMDFNIQLSDEDLNIFVARARAVEANLKNKAPAEVVAAARKLIAGLRQTHMPAFIADRLGTVDSMIAMAEDVGFGLTDKDRARVLAALDYLVDSGDLIPDSVPVLGYLDDAIVIELCRNDLRYSLEEYEDFCDWRRAEAEDRGIDPATLGVQRTDWADARAAEAIARMQRRRSDSYASGAWKPTLFRIT